MKVKKKRGNTAVTFAAIFSILFLYVPLLSIAVFSVNQSKTGLNWTGFTLSWYLKLFQNEYIHRATLNTVVLAMVSTFFSTLLGTAAAIGLYRHPWARRSKRVMDMIMHLPVITPDIVFAVALILVFSLFRAVMGVLELGMLTMIIGHITFQVSFVALVVYSRLEIIAHDIEEAAYDLYASYGRMLFKVLLPLLIPGIMAGAMLAFTLSLDDFVISFFTAGPKSTTLPLFIYASLRRGVSPEIHALSTLIMVITVVTVVTIQKVIGTDKAVSLIG